MAAKVGGEVAIRLKFPEVVGELAAGMVLAALHRSWAIVPDVATAPAADLLATVGVILLMFSVGLESTVPQMIKVGLSATLVAVTGVVAPAVMGLGAAYLLIQGPVSITVALFIGACLCATSVGISARVLAERGAGNTPEGRVILGAAVIDDVLGLLVLVIVLVLGFRTSSNLASAYGIAVTGTMFITACMLGVLTFAGWKWPPLVASLVTGAFLIVDGAYFASNVTKIPDGGWFPLLVAAITFTILTTWATGRRILRDRLAEDTMAFDLFLGSVAGRVRRVSGTSVFLSSTADGIPPALLHNLKHNHVLHDRVVVLTVITEGVPHVPEPKRREVEDMGSGFYRMLIHVGFMDEVDIPAELASETRAGGPFKPMETSYFLARQTLIPSARPGMAIWREQLFAWMVRNASSAMEFFKLPTNRVIELGSQLEI
jgi:hypothetical protein